MMTSLVVICVCGVIGVALLAVGLRGKRCGDERRCRHCGYELTGNVAGRCSECGREFTDATVVIGRRRRRWGFVAAGAVSLGVGVCILANALGGFNFYGVCPSYGLVMLAKCGNVDSLNELDTRICLGNLRGVALRTAAAAALDRQSVQWEECRERQTWINLLETLDIGGQLTDAEQKRYHGQAITVDELTADKTAMVGDEWQCRLDLTIRDSQAMFSEVKVVDVAVGTVHYPYPDSYTNYHAAIGVGYGQFVLTTKVDQEPGVYPVAVSLEVVLARGSQKLWSQSLTYTGEIEIRVPDPSNPTMVKINELLRRVPPAWQEEQWDEARRNRIVTNADYLALADAVCDVKLMDEQWRYALEHTGIIQIRERWPRGTPLTIGLIAPRWSAPCKIEASPRILGRDLLGWKPLLAQNVGVPDLRDVIGPLQQSTQLTYGYPDDATSRVEFDCRVWRKWRKERRPWDEQPLRLEWEGTVALPITLVSTVDEVMEAVTDEQLAKPMRQFVDVRCTLQEGPAEDEAYATVMVSLDRTQSRSLDMLALGLTVDLVLDGETLACEVMTTMKLSMDGKVDCGICNQATLHTTEWRAGAKQGARLRFRSNAEAALQQLDCPKYWSGEFEVGLADVLK